MRKNPVFLASAAMVIYATQNVMMELKLARFNTIVLILLAECVMLPLTLSAYLYIRNTGAALEFPSGTFLALTLTSGLMWWAADFAYVSAYTSGGKVEVIATVVALYPAMAAAVKVVSMGTLPNRYQVASFILAPVVVYLATRGSAH